MFVLCFLQIFFLSGCMAPIVTYNNIKPLEPEPHSFRFHAPVLIESLTPTFRWEMEKPDLKVDLIIWKFFGDGAEVYYKKSLPNGAHTINKSLIPDSIYSWSIRKTGTKEWSTVNRTLIMAFPLVGYEKSQGRFFKIKTPKSSK